MDRLIATNSVVQAQADTAPVTGTPQYATDGNPGLNIPQTIWPAYQYNAIQEEILAVLTAAGIAPDRTNLGQLATSIAALIAQATRTRLTANTNFYVNAGAGSDANTGLASGAAWATLQHAWNVLKTYDLNGFTATINVANGTYAPLSASGMPAGALSPSQLVFLGNTGSPSSCIVNAVNASAFFANAGAQFTVEGFHVTATGTGNAQGCGLLVSGRGGAILFADVDFGACAAAHIAVNAGSIGAIGPYSISGGAPAHWLADQQGAITTQGIALTLTGTPAFSAAFAQCAELSLIICSSMTFTGTATGPRYSATNNAVINTNGGGASYLPGSTAGSATSGLYV